MYFVLDLLSAFLYSLFFTHGSPFKSNLFIRSSAVCNHFCFPQLVFEPCYILLEDETHSSHSHGHNARHRQSVLRIAFVMGNCCCKYKLLEKSRLLSHADMRTIGLSRIFHQVTQLLCNTTTPLAVHLRKMYIHLRQQLKLYGKYTFISTSKNFIKANELSITPISSVISVSNASTCSYSILCFLQCIVHVKCSSFYNCFSKVLCQKTHKTEMIMYILLYFCSVF